METELIITWIVAILGTVIGLGSFFHFRAIRANWRLVTAQVIGNFGERTGSTTNGHITRKIAYFAQLQFNARGQDYVVKGDLGKSKEWPLGDTVRLYYNPENPNHTLSEDIRLHLVFSGGFLLFGILCWLIIAGVIG